MNLPNIAPVAAALVLAATTLPADANLILLEQFDYPGENQPLDGKDGGEGFGTPWVVTGWSRNYDTGRTLFAPNPGVQGTTVNATGGLEFGDHPVAGAAIARYGTAGQREAHRTLSADSIAALTADGTTIWFSVLAGAPTGNKYGTFIFGNAPMLAVQGAADNGNLSTDGQGFGVTFTADGGGSGSGSPNAVAFIDDPVKTIANGSYTPPITGTHHDTSLIVGKIVWNPLGTEDQLFLFNMASTLDPQPADADAIATLSADFDQSTWDTIALWDTGATIYDEIRFGTSYGDVTLGASTADAFRIPATITRNGDAYDLTWASQSGRLYNVFSSTDLSNWTLVEGDIPADPDTNTKTLTPPAATAFYYRVEEFPKPPSVIFFEDFDAATGFPAGWTTDTNTGDTGTTQWQVGTPTTTGPPAASSGTNCAGTNLAAGHGISSDIWLRTPATIDLTNATSARLLFQQWVEMDDFDLEDAGSVRVVDAAGLPGTVTELGIVKADIQGLNPQGWTQLSARIPSAALGRTVAIEFRFKSDQIAAVAAAGWYIDDVTVSAAGE